MPSFGVGAKTPSAVRDIQVADEIPGLVRGLPEMPIVLTSETPVLSPLEENPDPGTGARAALTRGPASADAGTPVLILMTDDGFEEPKGARLLLFGLSMGWLPVDVDPVDPQHGRTDAGGVGRLIMTFTGGIGC